MRKVEYPKIQCNNKYVVGLYCFHWLLRSGVSKISLRIQSLASIFECIDVMFLFKCILTVNINKSVQYRMIKSDVTHFTKSVEEAQQQTKRTLGDFKNDMFNAETLRIQKR